MSIDTHKALIRRKLAIEATREIILLPGFPFDDQLPLTMVSVIERYLKNWESQKELA